MGAAGGRIDAAFEGAPVLVARLRPLVADVADADTIMRMARALVRQMDDAQRIAILDAHPRIGAAPAALSTLSRAEQGSEAEGDVLRELAALNDEYERRFGFRFVVFVHGRGQREIAGILRARLRRARDVELATGIEEFLAIANDRLTRVSC